VWSSLAGEMQVLILVIAVGCGVSLIAASAAAASQLLGSAGPAPDGSNRVWMAELILVAGVTGWVSRWFAAFWMPTALHPRSGEWLVSVDLDAAVTGAWVVSWALGVAVLAVLRVRRRGRRAGLPG
jgi:hypothetical protein